MEKNPTELADDHSPEPRPAPLYLDPWLDARLDPSLRLVLRLIASKDFHQLFLRTGIDEKNSTPPYRLPILVELNVSDEHTPLIHDDLHTQFNVPLAYAHELKTNKNFKLRHVTASIEMGAEILEGDVGPLIQSLTNLLGKSKRLSLGTPVQPLLEGSIRDIGLPIDRVYNGHILTGDKVVVGIIDDGCALANWNFLHANSTPQSRIVCLWDQAATAPRSGGWTELPDFPYGLEITNHEIDAALNDPANFDGRDIAEQKVHASLEYPIVALASHGTRVMDIAAGNGQALMGNEGVARDARIVFVQLPRYNIEGGMLALWNNILDGATYVFNRAQSLGLPAVVNVSYGGYDGPHDGTNSLEQGLDGLLAFPDRSVVIAAGNGFEAGCHATEKIGPQKRGRLLQWILLAEDPTPNDLEIWYEGGANLEVRLTPPGKARRTAWVGLGNNVDVVRRGDNRIVGNIDHKLSWTGNGDNVAYIALRSTIESAEDHLHAPAPSGTWLVELQNVGAVEATVHAWIHRDDSGRPDAGRRRQSHFAPENVDPRYSIASLATGSLTISVGAHNVVTQEICRYSACGPTRPTGGQYGRPKPDVYAPAEEDVAGRGVLSASSGRSRPTRINGTSAAAPHVAGIVALIFEYAQKVAGQSLSAAQIRDTIERGAIKHQLHSNLHQREDDVVPVKQNDVMPDLVGSGKVDFLGAMRNLFP